MEEEGERLRFRMTDFERNLCDTIGDLRSESAFFDVTLGCNDEKGRSLKAHKVLLAACSEFFKNVFIQEEHPKPFIFLKGVSFSTLQSILDFVYQGSVCIKDEDVKSFLATTTELKIKGLSSPDDFRTEESTDDDTYNELLNSANSIKGLLSNDALAAGDVTADVSNNDILDPTDPTPLRSAQEPSLDDDVAAEEELKLYDFKLEMTEVNSVDEHFLTCKEFAKQGNTDNLKDIQQKSNKMKSKIDITPSKESELLKLQEKLNIVGTLIQSEEDQAKDKKNLKPQRKEIKVNGESHLSSLLKQIVQRLADGRCKCKSCFKTFNNYVGIRQHIDVVHNEQAEVFQCETCSKSIKGKQMFRIHRNRHNKKR